MASSNTKRPFCLACRVEGRHLFLLVERPEASGASRAFCLLRRRLNTSLDKDSWHVLISTLHMETGKSHSRTVVLSLCINDILLGGVIFIVGAVLWITAGHLIISLAGTCQQQCCCYNKNIYLQVLLNVPQKAKLPPAENHCSKYCIEAEVL